MLKNYTNEEQKLPLFGVGPYIVYGMAVVNIRKQITDQGDLFMGEESDV